MNPEIELNLALILFIQLLLGAWVAGLNAGLVSDSWPLMHGRFVPEYDDTRGLFYGEYRFADVFARATRAPWPLLPELRALPGVRQAEGRVVAGVNLEVAGFEDAVTGLMVSLPDPAQGGLNAIFLREGRLPDPARAELLSKLRAMAVRRELARHGVIFREISGLGDELPVAANDADEGRIKNRRVEVWVY